jgi:phosphomannomutase / phosphoglucomutase
MVLKLGTNGVRAKFDELNPVIAMDFGFAFALWVKNNYNSKGTRYVVAVAKDMRKTSPCLTDAVCAGLMEGGVDVLDMGLLPSPIAEWALKKYSADGLVIVTASHNPAEWNALKFVDQNAVAISRERGDSFSDFIGKKHEPVLKYDQIGKIKVIDNVLLEYKKAVLSFTNGSKINKKLKIVADPGNGTATLIAPELFRELGAEVIIINEKLDGTFPNRSSEPSEANLEKLIETVKKENADFGIAWDGDADRVTFVDEKGRWIVGDKCVALCVQWALMHHKNPQESLILTTSATSKVVEDVATEFGAKTIYTDVGAPYLAEKFFELGKKAVSGGEEVGGIVFADFSIAKDGVLAGCKLMEMVCQQKLSEWVDDLPIYYNSKTKVEVSTENKDALIQKVKEKLNENHQLLNLKGGFRLNAKDHWVLVRASGTENYIRIFAEALDQQKAEKLMNQYKDLVVKALGK